MLCLALLMRPVVSNYRIRTFEVCSEKSSAMIYESSMTRF